MTENAFNPRTSGELVHTYPYRCWTLGKLFVSRCTQGGGAPVIDVGTTWSVDGWTAACWVLRLRRGPGLAWAIGWMTVRHICPPGARLRSLPLLGLLFRMRP